MLGISICILFLGINMATQTSSDNKFIDLKSDKGEKLLNEATLKNMQMIKLHKYQENLSYCGPASLALVSNAINAGYRLKYRLLPNDDGTAEQKLVNLMKNGPVLINEAEILQCIDEDIVKQTKIDTDGLTLGELFEFAMHLGFGVNCYYVFCKNEKSKLPESKQRELEKLTDQSDYFLIDNIDDFRSRVVRNIAHKGRDRQIQGIIMNYDMGHLDSTGKSLGHFSPIAAFNKEKDMVLLLDVWPGNKLKWVPLETLWKSVALTVDTSSNLPRGFLHIYELM